MYSDSISDFKVLNCELIIVNTSKKLGEYSDNFKNQGCTVWHLPYPEWYKPFSKILYCIALFALLKRENIDVVHTHTNSLKWIMSLVSFLAGKRSVYTFHNVFISKWYSYYYHIWLRWSAKFILGCKFHTISDSVFEHELKYYKNKTKKILNWYNDNRFFPASQNEKMIVRKSLNLPDDAFVLISVGGCSYIKRHSEILLALQNILKIIPNVIYIHLGKGYTECDEIMMAKELNVEHAVRFCGNRNNVRDFLVASDIYLMTSKFEGMPITTIEALACKIPAILYNVPGLKDFNRLTVNSILVEENFLQLSDEIVKLKKSPEKIQELIENGYSFVAHSFNMKRNVALIYELYL